LDAPIQIDEGNVYQQDLFMNESHSRLEKVIRQKQFPLEIVLIALILCMVYLILKNRDRTPKLEAPPVMTAEERIQQAAQILAKADENLSKDDALSIINLLDPLTDTLPDPVPYYHLSEQVKFAAYIPQKSEIDAVLVEYR
jgi:hypothetical protein